MHKTMKPYKELKPLSYTKKKEVTINLYKSRIVKSRNAGIPCTKMGADKSDENTPNAPKFICSIFLHKSKSYVNFKS